MRSIHPDHTLFPPQSPKATYRLDVGDGHELYIEDCGNSDGIPVIFLHGGPGAGISTIHRRMFDPDLFRVILFDQRGSGQSRPFAETSHNTTQDLINDIEKIRKFFGIKKWLVFGGSWGSTLGLVYGITHPAQCHGFVLRGIFLGTQAEIDWFLYGMGKFYPEAWTRFTEAIPASEQADLLGAYAKRLMSDIPSLSIPAAEQWSAYENSCATLKSEYRGGGGRMALSLARLEVHYFRKKCFLEDGFISADIDKIKHLPSIIVQGRHDVICPPHTATALAKAWGERADLVMVDEAGHSALESGILDALLSGLNRIATNLAQ